MGSIGLLAVYWGKKNRSAAYCRMSWRGNGRGAGVGWRGVPVYAWSVAISWPSERNDGFTCWMFTSCIGYVTVTILLTYSCWPMHTPPVSSPFTTANDVQILHGQSRWPLQQNTVSEKVRQLFFYKL